MTGWWTAGSRRLPAAGADRSRDVVISWGAFLAWPAQAANDGAGYGANGASQ